MPRPRPTIDTDHFNRLRADGVGIAGVAQAFGVSVPTIWHWHKKGWVDMGQRPRIKIDEAKVVEMYGSGVSANEIARAFGVSVPTIRSRLGDAGVEIDPLRHRTETLAKAHAAVRGSTKTADVMIRRARSRRQNIGAGEAAMIAALAGAGLPAEPQWPCERYNIDVLVGSVAVEVWRHSSANFLRKPTARHRIEQIRDAGKSLLVVQFRRDSAFAAHLQKSISFLHLANRHPAILAHDWMIRCSADGASVSKIDADQMALVPAPIELFDLMQQFNR